jgi:hypothetical protein
MCASPNGCAQAFGRAEKFLLFRLPSDESLGFLLSSRLAGLRFGLAEIIRFTSNGISPTFANFREMWATGYVGHQPTRPMEGRMGHPAGQMKAG